MNENDQELMQDAALGKLVRLKQKLALANVRGVDFAVELESVAELIRKNPTNISPGFYAWSVSERLKPIIDDIQLAETEVSAAYSQASKLGVPLPESP